MVAGAAALLVEALRVDASANAGDDDDDDDDDRIAVTPTLLKALLMNTANSDIRNDVTGVLAPITRIGAGEVRVDQALEAQFVAMNADDGQPTLAFGQIDVDRRRVRLRRRVRVVNLTDEELRLRVRVSDRFTDDTDTGAVTLSAPRVVEVDDDDGAVFTVTLTIRGDRLRPNLMSSGAGGADPGPLTTNEYDGYLSLEAAGQSIQLPWHVLPRQAAQVRARRTELDFDADGQDILRLRNRGMGVAQNEAFTLIALSDDQPRGAAGTEAPSPDLRAVGVRTVEVPTGVCSESPSFVWEFAINTWERQAHLLPVSHQVNLDIDRDGVDDYQILNRDISGLSSLGDGRQVSYVLNLLTGEAQSFFFAEHGMNTANTVLRACAEQLGLSVSDLGRTAINASVVASDFYFGGPGDTVGDMTLVPGGEPYQVSVTDVEPRARGDLQITRNPEAASSTTALGVLLLTNGDRGPASRGGTVAGSEALIFTAPGVTKPQALPPMATAAGEDADDDEG